MTFKGLRKQFGIPRRTERVAAVGREWRNMMGFLEIAGLVFVALTKVKYGEYDADAIMHHASGEEDTAIDPQLIDNIAQAICIQIWQFAQMFKCVIAVAEGNFELKDHLSIERRQRGLNTGRVTSVTDCIMKAVFQMLAASPTENQRSMLMESLKTKKLNDIDVYVLVAPGEGEAQCLSLYKSDQHVVLATSGDGDFLTYPHMLPNSPSPLIILDAAVCDGVLCGHVISQDVLRNHASLKFIARNDFWFKWPMLAVLSGCDYVKVSGMALITALKFLETFSPPSHCDEAGWVLSVIDSISARKNKNGDSLLLAYLAFFLHPVCTMDGDKWIHKTFVDSTTDFIQTLLKRLPNGHLYSKYINASGNVWLNSYSEYRHVGCVGCQFSTYAKPPPTIPRLEKMIALTLLNKAAIATIPTLNFTTINEKVQMKRGIGDGLLLADAAVLAGEYMLDQNRIQASLNRGQTMMKDNQLSYKQTGLKLTHYLQTDDKRMWVRGESPSSYKTTSYKSYFLVKQDLNTSAVSEIVYSFCTCTAGHGIMCAHRVAVLCLWFKLQTTKTPTGLCTAAPPARPAQVLPEEHGIKAGDIDFGRLQSHERITSRHNVLVESQRFAQLFRAHHQRKDPVNWDGLPDFAKEARRMVVGDTSNSRGPVADCVVTYLNEREFFLPHVASSE